MRPGAVVIFCLAVLLALPSAAERGPSTPKERAKALKLIRQLEEDPDFEGSRDARRWLSLWLFQVPDLQVDLCPELLGGNPVERKRLPGEVVGQLMYSGAAFLMEHKNGSREQVYLAGVTGALKVYESLLAERPHARSALLDGLIGRREAGTLAAHVAEAMKSCPPPSLKTR
jgi:carboxypeptidase Q